MPNNTNGKLLGALRGAGLLLETVIETEPHVPIGNVTGRLNTIHSFLVDAASIANEAPAPDVNAELLAALEDAESFVGKQAQTPEGLLLYAKLHELAKKHRATAATEAHEGHRESRK